MTPLASCPITVNIFVYILMLTNLLVRMTITFKEGRGRGIYEPIGPLSYHC